jgi:glucokinase
MTMSSPIPVLEVGGSHVTAALVDTAAGRVVLGTRRRRPLRPEGSADETVARILACAEGLGSLPAARWGVAVPGPFDYEHGIALFEGVGKFDALFGLDLGRELRNGLAGPPAAVSFLNDADAFLLGEWAAGAATGHDRAVGITLGTGIGSAFLAAGSVLADGADVPPEGRADLLRYDGRPLEETVSSRAITKAYAGRGSLQHPVDVRGVADLARGGDLHARAALDGAFTVLGEVLGPWIDRFRATILVVGGAMTGSWELIEAPLWQGLVAGRPNLAARCGLARARLGEDAALLGAAQRAASRMPAPVRHPERGSAPDTPATREEAGGRGSR